MRIKNEWGNFDTFDPFMDYNAGFWTKNLGYYIEEFSKARERLIPLKWQNSAYSEGYSILVNPCGSVVFEIMSDRIPDKFKSMFKKEYPDRLNFKLMHEYVREQYLFPVKISRATERMGDIK